MRGEEDSCLCGGLLLHYYNRLTHTTTTHARLLLWGGSNHSFPSFNEFQAKFLKRGELSILELLAVEMKARLCAGWIVCLLSK